jgi:hypothetical protein
MKTISGSFQCGIKPIRFPDEVAVLYFPLNPKTRERRGTSCYQMRTEAWAAIRGRLLLSAHELDRIEGDLRDGLTANLGYLKQSFEIDEGLYKEVPLIYEEVNIQGHPGTFRVTLVDEGKKIFSAEHTNTGSPVENIPWGAIYPSKPEGYAG